MLQESEPTIAPNTTRPPTFTRHIRLVSYVARQYVFWARRTLPCVLYGLDGEGRRATAGKRSVVCGVWYTKPDGDDRHFVLP